MEDIRIDHHPDHWKSTLLGEDFWKDAELFNQPTHDDIEAEHDQLLYTKFPFNLGPEQGPRPNISDEVPSKKQSQPQQQQAEPARHRRFSMNDALNFSPTSLRSNRFVEFGRRARSRSRSRSPSRSPSVASESRQSGSILRSAFNMVSSKTAKDEDTDIESILSTRVPQEPGTPAKPLMFFRGGASWNCLPRDMQGMGIDLFWPVKQDQEVENDREVLHIEEMAPLCQFRRLRVLKITGMLQSYQKYIWQAAWLNTELEELELGMALGPRIRRNFTGDWPFIKGGWCLREDTYGEPVYYGQMGTGNLDRKIGLGAYLDKTSIEKAKVRAMATGRTLNRLSIKTLTLTGFVVDADPILLWFDPKRLRSIHFQDNCVDAGFYLCLPMRRRVVVRFPMEVKERVMSVRRVDLRGELRVVEIRGGRKVGEMVYSGDRTSLHAPVHREDGKDLGRVSKTNSNSLRRNHSPRKKDKDKDKDTVKEAVVEIENVDEYEDSTDSENESIDEEEIYQREMFVSKSSPRLSRVSANGFAVRNRVHYPGD